ncbi:MAG: hypothetical protein QNJ72_36410 [Pleurocapsa sp. MO_226.B13]|nr:hypothetical protein [Pleurocapsa sp. MO_226.B13]
MDISWQYPILIVTTLLQIAMSVWERKTLLPPGELINLGDRQIHLWVKGKGTTTVVLDHSLGGIEGYFLIEAIALFTRVCICDRPA